MAPIQFIFGYSYSHNTHNLPQNTCVWANLTFSFFAALILFFPSVRMQTPLTMLQVIHPSPPPPKINIACIVCLCLVYICRDIFVTHGMCLWLQWIWEKHSQKYMLSTGQGSVRMLKNCDLGLQKMLPEALPRSQGSIFETKVTVFHLTDRALPGK